MVLPLFNLALELLALLEKKKKGIEANDIEEGEERGVSVIIMRFSPSLINLSMVSRGCRVSVKVMVSGV